MGYISVICTNPNCAKETTRKEDTEYCPHCGHYTQPIAGLTQTAQPAAPMINNNIPAEALQQLAQAEPLEFSGHDMKLILEVLNEKHLDLFTSVVQLETEGDNSSAEYYKQCSRVDHAMKVMNKIKKDFKRQRAKVEINRRLTGFYSKSENHAVRSMAANNMLGAV